MIILIATENRWILDLTILTFSPYSIIWKPFIFIFNILKSFYCKDRDKVKKKAIIGFSFSNKLREFNKSRNKQEKI